MNPQYWYNYVDIDILLKSKCENQYYVWDSMSQDFHQFSRTVKDVCKNLKNNKEYINTTVIPINAGYVNDGKYEGLHWVGLVIKIDSNDTFKVFYCDSLGNSLNESLKYVLNENGINSNAIQDCSDRQQHNAFDCGPFLVFNLDSLAKTGHLPLDINEDAILNQRLDLKRLIECGSEENKLVDIPDLDSSVVIEEFISREEADRRKDMKILEMMFKAIAERRSGPVYLRILLIFIGDLANMISYNNTGDKENRYIRNRYGYTQRKENTKKNKKKGKCENPNTNKDGIYFERLYHLKIILSNDEIYSFISNKELYQLQSSLSGLKQKIAYILHDQNASIGDTTGDFSASIEGLIDFSRKYYDPLLIAQMKQEFELWEQVDFSTKDDRYYLARLLCKIGELFKELCVNLSVEDEQQDIMVALKFFVKLRDEFVHRTKFRSRDKIKFGLGPEESRSINASIVDIKYHLKHIIKPNQDEDNRWPQFQIDCGYREAREFRNAAGRLFSHITGKVVADENAPGRRSRAEKRKEKHAKQLTDEKINCDKLKMRNKLDKLVMRSCNMIKEDGTVDTKDADIGKSAKSIGDQLKHFNVEYQSYLEKLGDTIDRNHYAPSLSLEYTDSIIKCGQSLKKFSENVEVENSRPNKIGEEVKYMTLHNVQATHVSVDNPEESGRKLISYIQDVMTEIEFLFTITIKRPQEAQARNSPHKLSYILQYIMLVIGQLMRDIDNLRICRDNSVGQNVASFNPENLVNSILPHLKKLKSWTLFIEGKILSKWSRNKGLAHNITTFDEAQFFRIIQSLLPSIIHLGSFCELFQRNSDDVSVETFQNIVKTLSKMGLYDEAVEYLLKAIGRYELDPAESSDEYKIVLGMDRSLYRLYRQLSSIHLDAERYDKFNEVSELLMDNIKSEKIGNCSESLRKNISEIYCNTHFRLKAQGKHEEAIRILQDAELIFESSYTKICLANLYLDIKKYEKAHELCSKIIRCSPHYLDVFDASNICISICSQQLDRENRITEIRNCVHRMETLLRKNLTKFKSIYGDDYMKLNLAIIYGKLTIILENYRQNRNETAEEFELTKLKELEREFQDIKNRLWDGFQHDPKVITLYFTFCVTFCCIFDTRNIHLDVNGENLTKAQLYFDLATNTLPQLSEDRTSYETNLATAASCLSNAYNHSAMFNDNLSNEVIIKYLMKALNLQENYNLRKTRTLNSLGIQFNKIGIEYYKIFQQNGQQEFVDLSLANLDNAVKYYSLTLHHQIGEGDTEAINGIQVDMAYTYNTISILRFDLKLIRESISRFGYLLTLPLSETKNSDLIKFKMISEAMLFQITEVLNEILNSPSGYWELKFVNECGMEYCRRRLNIQFKVDEVKTEWFYEGELSIDELKYKIQKELI